MTYASEVAADAPLAWYRMGNGVANGPMTDASGNARNGTMGNTPVTGAGTLVGSSSLCNVFNQTLAALGSVANAAWMQPSVFTIELWARHNGSSGDRYMCGRGTPASPVFGLFLSTAGRASFTLTTTAGTVICTAGLGMTLSPTPEGVLRHVVGTYDGTTMSLYYDGALVATAAQTGTMVTSTAPFLVGNRTSATSESFAGSIDEVALYGTALSATRIKAHYDAANVPQGDYTYAVVNPPVLLASRTATVYLLQFQGGGGAAVVPTTGQIWPRGSKAAG